MEHDEEVIDEVLEQKELQEAMEDFSEVLDRAVNGAPTPTPSNKSDKENHSQWALGGNGRFMPVGATVTALPPGIYEPFAVPGMWGLEQLSVASDGIHTLPDMATETVLTEVNKFWSSESKYRAHNLLYKRGIILTGPPGGGKTVCIKLLMNELVKRGGIVVIASQINLTIMCLKAVRRIETNRNLIVVLEDIDEIINHNGEAIVLSMLDGENNIDNILHLATTNYPDRLGARIINRPSRFDRRVIVGMPGAEARKVYIQKTTNNGVSDADIAQWVIDTDGMSVAHLRELVASVYCLEQPYNDVLVRLKAMATQPKSEAEFKPGKSMGFGRVGRSSSSGE